jgi:hypothetical protein
MKREYDNGPSDQVVLFRGLEIERTLAYGLQTLFISGCYDITTLEMFMNPNYAYARGIEHVYLGANQSFDPGDWRNGHFELTDRWTIMIEWFLKNFKGLVTLDFDVSHIEWVLDGGFTESHNFIPQVSVKLPHIQQLGYNAVLKMDDRDFNSTNPGVWCHSVHQLMDRNNFTDWTRYGKDAPLLTLTDLERLIDSSLFNPET